MEKLIKIGEKQIDKLLKIQAAFDEDEVSLEIDNNIRDWTKTVIDCKKVETSKEFINKFGEVINPLM